MVCKLSLDNTTERKINKLKKIEIPKADSIFLYYVLKSFWFSVF